MTNYNAQNGLRKQGRVSMQLSLNFHMLIIFFTAHRAYMLYLSAKTLILFLSVKIFSGLKRQTCDTHQSLFPMTLKTTWKGSDRDMRQPFLFRHL